MKISRSYRLHGQRAIEARTSRLVRCASDECASCACVLVGGVLQWRQSWRRKTRAHVTTAAGRCLHASTSPPPPPPPPYSGLVGKYPHTPCSNQSALACPRGCSHGPGGCPFPTAHVTPRRQAPPSLLHLRSLLLRLAFPRYLFNFSYPLSFALPSSLSLSLSLSLSIHVFSFCTIYRDDFASYIHPTTSQPIRPNEPSSFAGSPMYRAYLR